MSLYKKAGVNPAAGCIPLLLQIPILFALIRLFPTAFELRQKHFFGQQIFQHTIQFGTSVSIFLLW